MDILFAQIQADLRSNDGLRQAGGLLQALQQSAAGKDISAISKCACDEIIASPASAVCKKLAFDLIRCTRLTADQWETVCRGIKNDFDFPDPDVTAAGVSFLAAIPSYRLGKLITDCSKEISNCLVSENDNLRYAITETLGCILARDDLVTLCENNVNLLDKVSLWWKQIGNNMLDVSDAVSKVAFEAVGRLFQEFSSKRMSRLAGDKLIPSENSLAIRSNWVIAMANFVWTKRNMLIARSLVVPVESFRVFLFKRLLLMVRNLRAESDRMHALACICRTALCVDLFAKESVRRGQKPHPGTDIASLFEDPRIKEDLNSVTSNSLFREELVASLVESCFQLSLPLPKQKNFGTESRVIGALAYGTGYGAMNWTESALEVVEVCRPCVKWDCEGRTYAMDCYLKLLVRLCHIYDTRGGVKKVKDGASQDQILNETRLHTLQQLLVKDLSEVNTPRICARLIWALAEHFDLDGLDPLLADDPEDPLNIIISNMHKVLFSVDSSAPTATNRLQDVQAVLLCAQHLGSRYSRGAQLLTKELEDFRNNNLADSVNKHQCRLILQIMKYITTHPEDRYAAAVLNLTEQELNRVDIRVGLTGALHFMDGSPQAVRQLQHLVSQDPVPCSVTVGVSRFERVQVLYYPFHGTASVGDVDDGEFLEEDPSIVMRHKRTSRPEFGESIVLRCQPYKIPLTELLLPQKCSPVEYFRIWPSLPAILEFTGAYTYEGSGFKATAALESEAPPFLSGLKSLPSKPFLQVCSHILRTVAGFQLCYSAKTWYGGFLGMMIFGASEVSRNVDFGDETTTMMCKFVLRASEASILNEISADLQDWLDDLTDGAVEYMPEEEVKAAAAERLRRSMEQMAILKAARPPPQPPKEEEDNNLIPEEKPKEPSTLTALTAEEAEHRALQAAVLQEWQMLRMEQTTKVN